MRARRVMRCLPTAVTVRSGVNCTRTSRIRLSPASDSLSTISVVAESADTLQLHRAAVFRTQLHNLGQRQQHRHHVRGRGRGRVGDVLAQFLGRHGRFLCHGSHRPLLVALPFAFYFLDKSYNINNLSIGLKSLVPQPFVEVSARPCRGLDSTMSRSQLDNVESRPRQMLFGLKVVVKL